MREQEDGVLPGGKKPMRVRDLVRLMMLVLVVGLIGIPLYAQGRQQQEQPPSAKSDYANQPQNLTGKIVESQGHLVFQDEATNTAYRLDNESQFKSYVGKTVTVQATVDSANNMLHVSSINAASPPK
jgi:hypothetical protein